MMFGENVQAALFLVKKASKMTIKVVCIICMLLRNLLDYTHIISLCDYQILLDSSVCGMYHLK